MSIFLKVIKGILWICVFGYGLTLINTTGLIFKVSESYVDVRVKNGEERRTVDGGEVSVNKGTYVFNSNNIVDRILYQHVKGYHDFPSSLFTFAICVLLLSTVNKLNLSNPFTADIAKRITLIGCLYLVYGILKIGIALYNTKKVSSFNDDMVAFFPTFRYDLVDIKVGVFVLMLAFIYKVGALMQEEQRLTV